MMKKSKILGFYTDVMRKKSFGSTAFRNHFGLILLSESFRGTLISERQEREPSLKKKTKKNKKKNKKTKKTGRRLKNILKAKTGALGKLCVLFHFCAIFSAV